VNRVYNFVYGWMALALAISGGVAWYVANHLLGALSTGMFYGCFFVEIALVLAMRMGVRKFPLPAIATLFTLYAVFSGATLSIILAMYTPESITSAFFITAGTFAVMALIGTTTKIDLSRIGGICVMALIGVVIASLVNIFMQSSGLSYLLSLVCVGLFVGLSAYDAQKVRLLAEAQERGMMDTATVNRWGLILALELYLDVVNLFISIVRLMGDRK
jgi:FtsH-binding integral membrane protein